MKYCHFKYATGRAARECLEQAISVLLQHGLVVNSKSVVIRPGPTREQLLKHREDVIQRYPEYASEDFEPYSDGRFQLVMRSVKVTTVTMASADDSLRAVFEHCDRNEFAMFYDGFWMGDEIELLGGMLKVEGEPIEKVDEIRADFYRAWSGRDLPTHGVCSMLRAKADSSDRALIDNQVHPPDSACST
jgi:hypothetical protein